MTLQNGVVEGGGKNAKANEIVVFPPGSFIAFMVAIGLRVPKSPPPNHFSPNNPNFSKAEKKITLSLSLWTGGFRFLGAFWIWRFQLFPPLLTFSPNGLLTQQANLEKKKQRRKAAVGIMTWDLLMGVFN